jgi:acyl-CoA thioester hydrolase
VLQVEFLAPLSAPGPMRVELTARRLGTTSATYLLRCAGRPTFAQGHRVIVKIDEAGRPVPWSLRYREAFQRLADGQLPEAIIPEARQD